MFKGIKIAVVWVVAPVILFGCVVQAEHNLAIIRLQDAQMEHMRVYNDMRIESLNNKILELQFMLDTVESDLASTKRNQEWSMDWLLGDIDNALANIDEGVVVDPTEVVPVLEIR